MEKIEPKLYITCSEDDVVDLLKYARYGSTDPIRVYYNKTHDTFELYFCNKFTNLSDIMYILNRIQEKGFKLSMNISDILVACEKDTYTEIKVEKA